jgi:multicomponent Na+:H+ antiporter subunit G
MSVPAAVLVLLGGALAVLSGIGILRLRTPYARFHAAGKASPVAFLLAAVGSALELGWAGAARLGVASAAMVLTLPVGVHLLFRAVNRSTTNAHLARDDLAPAERLAPEPDDDG